MATYKGGTVPPDRLVGMDLDAPPIDISGVARGFGVTARLVSEPDELREALRLLLAETETLDTTVTTLLTSNPFAQSPPL